MTIARSLPGSLAGTPRLGRWLRVRRDGVIEVRSGKVEIGQGILTALAQIVADELDVDLARIVMVGAETGASPDEGVTSSSHSVQQSGTALRQAAAEARAVYLEVAAGRLGIAADRLNVDDGRISAPDGGRTSYWDLADDALLDHDATGMVAAKPAAARCLAGRSAARPDIADKVFGRRRHIHDLALPAMLHGRVLRPAAPGAHLLSLDSARAEAVPGVLSVVREGNFVGLVAEDEAAAQAALEYLRAGAQWSAGTVLPDMGALPAWLRVQPVETTDIARRERPGANPARTITRHFSRPFLAHASLGPSCALAAWHGGALTVWTQSQGIYNLRADLAKALAIPPENILVRHVEGAGCYGHNGADDVALDAALLARAMAGRPVRVQWSRADELAWAPFGPAMAITVEADLDADGRLLDWRHRIWSNGHSLRPGRAAQPTLLAAGQRDPGAPTVLSVNVSQGSGGGSDRNAVPLYDIPGLTVTNHRLLTMPIRTSAMRGLGAIANVFAIESMLDELAADAGVDPLDYRLGMLSDPRARAVLEAAALAAGWPGGSRGEGTGQGIGFARYKNSGGYCAVVAEIEADRTIRVCRLCIAADVGEVINPDGARNQLEGAAVQATSFALKEAVRFDAARILSDGWESYPILRFSEVPAVEITLLDRPLEPPLGAGECAVAPTVAAIGNAVFAALGVRIRDLPITPERILAALA